MRKTCGAAILWRRRIPRICGGTGKIPNQSALKEFLPRRNHAHKRKACHLPYVFGMDSPRSIRMHLLRQCLHRNHKGSCRRNFGKEGISNVRYFWRAT